ncbi:AAA family ATPase [Nitrospira sp. BLG_1]|uniref:AAA family ATPase n=1 Tax=Nitrospira sp. BLG_1 TaxID=3395883 RepID=UPI0039BD2387
MARLIAVSIDCRNEEVRRTFESIVSRRLHYLIAKGQGTGAVDMLLLELDEFRPQHTFDRVRQLLSAAPELEIFLTASRMDPQLLLEAFRVGVKEFLPQPLTRQEVEPALARFEERFSGKAASLELQAGRVIAVLGVRGGVGASTVATNLAVSVQQVQPREPVALIDLDIHGGDLGLFLDVPVAQGLTHLINDISRLDETILRSSLVRHSSGLHFLASGCEAYDDWKLAPGTMMRVMTLLRSFHQHVFVDCGHILDPSIREVMDGADQILVVTTLSLPAIRRTKRLLDVLGQARYPVGKVELLVNRYEKDQQDFLEETETMLNLQIAGLIPNDYGSASEAIQYGKPLTVMAAKTSIGQWYLREVGRLIGESTEGTVQSSKGSVKNLSFLGRCLSSLGGGVGRKQSTVSQ